MRKKNISEIDSDPVTDYGSIDTTIQWVWGPKDGVPNFFMRRFTIEPGGLIGLHDHPQEHEIYFLSGVCRVFNDKGEERIVKAGDTLYVPSDEPHGYENKGEEPVEFLCMIPKLKED
ncbi:MAG: cupin domain-containing protein [Promethearchaeota archaeon]